MDKITLQSFLENVEILLLEHERLKQQSIKINIENQLLKQENNHLNKQSNDSQKIFHKTLNQLKELQA